MEREIKRGNIYKHFKGHIYKVVAIAYDSENYNEENPELSKMVVYQNVEDKKQCWVRPYQMFNSLVDKEKYPDIIQEYRFEDITKEYRNNSKEKNTDKLSELSWESFEEKSRMIENEAMTCFDFIDEFDEEISRVPYAGLVSD